MSISRPLPRRDVEYVLRVTGTLWEALRGKRIFVTGGTGFFGRWMLETCCAANRQHGLGLKIAVLTRDPARLAREAPALAGDPAIICLQGSVRNLTAGEMSRQLGSSPCFDFVIHLATEADLQVWRDQPDRAAATVVEGSRSALDFAVAAGAKRFLFTSSGAVYARNPAQRSGLTEEDPIVASGSDPNAMGGRAKYSAEALCAGYASKHGLHVAIARCFSFIGPGLPLDGKFAAGNFVADALEGRNIVVKSDGSSVRSYLYAADLAVWLWTILLSGISCRPYNVGSEAEVTVGRLAELIASATPQPLDVEVRGKPVPNASVDCYVPSTERARTELGLREETSLEDAIQRMLVWHRLGD